MLLLTPYRVHDIKARSATEAAMALGKLDRVNERLQRQVARQIALGLTAEEFRAQQRAARKARKAAWIKKLAADGWQERSNAHHAAWVAAGMPTDFPNMTDWEAAKQPQS
jgi:hypothetical protein